MINNTDRLTVMFIDLVGWDYITETPHQRPSGDTQSAAYYLAEELAKLGHHVYLLNHTKSPQISRGVQCLATNEESWKLMPSCYAIFCINSCEPEMLKALRERGGERPLLILWIGRAVDHPDVQALGNEEVYKIIDALFLISKGQAEQYIDTFHIEPSRIRVVREQEKSPDEAESRLGGQIDQINLTSTWALRAREWVEKIVELSYQQVNISLVRTFMKMVTELHKKGYERIRIVPSMAASGCYWHCDITTKEETSGKHSVDFEGRKRLTVRYTTGQKYNYFGWADTSQDTTPEVLAMKFIERFPELAARGKGSDPEYVQWYSMMMTATEPDGIIYLWADWNHPTDRMNVLNLKNVTIPLPPPG